MVADAAMGLRYVILYHSGIPEPHFDLMFETFEGSDLATWRSQNWPILGPTPLVRLKDHRSIYLEYEGELSQRRGRVERVARGTCEVEIGADAIWRIRFLTGESPLMLVLHASESANWMAEPGAAVRDAQSLP